MSLRFFLVWFLSATVNLKNIQKLLNFLGGRVGSKAIEVEVEVNGKKLKIQSRNQQELLAAIEATKKFVCKETALPAIHQFPEEIFLKVTTKLETVQELETAKIFIEENRNSGLFLSADFYDIEQPLLPAETSPQSSTNLLQQTGRGLRPKLPKSEKTELDATNLYHEPPQNRPQTSSRNIPPVNQPHTQPIDNHQAFLEASSLLLRYPNLECPNQIILNEKFSLFVQLLIEQPKPSTQAIYVENSCTPAQLPEIEVVLRTPRGFDIEGNDYQLMQVKLDSDSSVEFNLTACKLGEQEIRVDFYQCDRRIGTERCSVLVVKEPLDYDVSKPKEVTSLELKIAPIVPPPDLELCIELRDDRTLYFTLHSKVAGYHHVKVGELTLKGSPLEKMQAVYKELGSLAGPIKSTEQAAAERRLATLGRELWDELIPDKLQQEYWRFKSLISSILITSDEPWVPWEVIKPYRYNEDGEREDEQFWCQQFALSRWLSGQGGTVEELQVGTARPIAPTQVNLSAVQEEVTFIKQLHNLRSDITVLEPFSTYQEVLDWLETGKFFMLHFACHGMFDATLPGNSAIKLSDGILRPSDIRVRFGGRRPRPLLFINACHGGRSEFSFTGLGGWAERLVTEARVAVFVGAMWEVNDGLALRFAQRFYTGLLKDNETIAEAFRYAREEIRQLAPYNSTWLAYSLYGDPQGRVNLK
ncbi:hypothetical protein CDG77_25975 [Nostoc sp. 'Peltigera membranacea cyanobiont' 213]|uniref:CHAT domain-containing protein n=1 Tax=Nostoc sp. 'Peltigera membranacea cyanobiont' 213 TaxID=2014530 RepID=UPI000B951FCC|nr:CHAT domain-containing protein [Nostoc sp. 'Peltigera membranacea cyanobiont' 213]OYD88036.1 hypothetical protein CDG77_25975 [Nostoc sp. 'Peltigera membranacea cyanobiont' 213]